jgi:hypothetical protein
LRRVPVRSIAATIIIIIIIIIIGAQGLTFVQARQSPNGKP